MFTLGPYYPTPFFGPIIGGTLVNSLGAFVPFDKGKNISPLSLYEIETILLSTIHLYETIYNILLFTDTYEICYYSLGLSPIQKGTPWPIQSAFISAVMYFFIVKDRDGFIGITIRSLIGDLSHRTVAGLIVAMQMLTLGAQVVFNDPNANFFTPIHEFVYYVLGLQGPISDTPVKDTAVSTEKTVKKHTSFHNFAVLVRWIGSAIFALYLISQRIPPVTLPAVSRDALYQHNGANYVTFNTVPTAGLSSAQPIGNCQWKSVLPFLGAPCPTYALRLEEFHHCTNETCRSVAECQTSFSPSACTVASLKGDYIDRASFRLAVHPTAVKGLHGALSSVVRAAGDALGLVNTNTQWSTALPLQVTSSHQLLALDPNYDFSKVSLFLTHDSELYLVSDPQFTGSFTDPAKMSARILWHGLPKYTCSAHGDDHLSTTAVALYLDAHTGVPRLQCSDSSSVELDVGEVYKDRAISMTYASLSNTAAAARNTVSAIGTGEAPAAASTKSEL